ncbi:hypothetical protein GCM10009760_49550 [Kitasatospora kazusensis]|uniref:Uncharacterized protein n=1 Tax=Kitasatospora kazusensis TaxID=407974 RepID=A0ABN3A3M6_9ACTN
MVLLGRFYQGLYIVTFVLGALAVGALTAPVAYHRVFTEHRFKPQLIDAAG